MGLLSFRHLISNRAQCLAVCAALAIPMIAPPGAMGATIPVGFAETVVATGLGSPTAMEFAPDGRLFVTQQGGSLRVIKNGALLATPFLTVTVTTSGERGLLGVAFDPNFATNQFVYVYYTATMPNIHNRISRFTANGDVAVAGSEVVILELNPLSGATNHNGGAIHFGADGKLYAAVGDNANGANSQTLTNLLGKILRINPDGSIPGDNPFVGTATGVNRAIWATGLRNPYTFSVQPATGRILINDVGQSAWEEIDDGFAGANYGWPDTEGQTSDPRFRGPIYAYPHSGTTPNGCAITGGAFYNAPTVPFPSTYVGDYFFADYCSGWIYKLEPSNNSVSQFATGISSPVDLKVSTDGALYYLARGASNNTGIVAKITYANTPPSVTTQPANRTVAVGQPASFSVVASGAAPLSYQWQRNGANIAGATSSGYTLASAQTTDNGARFRVIVTNPFGTATSNDAVLAVTSNQAPVATITQPTAATLYSGGQTINFAGTGTDPQDGTLPASAFTWEVVFHHATHTHPFVQPTSGITSGSFVIPTTGETAANVWYRIHLTVRDSANLTHTTFRDVTPRVVRLTVATSPAGLQVRIDGQPTLTPASFDAVVGIQRTIEAVTPQTLGATNYVFQSWSDGGATLHSISTPSANTTYTATYQATLAGTGDGLSAVYHDNQNFTGATVSRIDQTVNFDWGSGAPVAGIGADTFSVRWTGQVQAQLSEAYRFFTQSDDGVRLWVNGQLVVDNWTDHAVTENSGTIALTAGQRYAIRMEFYENGGAAVAKLLWSGPSTPKAVIPRSQLYSSAPTALAQDSFTRTVVNNWGTATSGGAWTLSPLGNAADFDVPGSVGTMTLLAGANRAAVLAGVSVADVDLSFRVATAKSAVGGNQYIYGIARRVSATAEYRAKLRFATNGAVFIQAGAVVNNVETAIGSEVLVPGLTHSPGSFIWLRAQFSGTSPTTIRIRAWADGATEPTTWQYTATNAAAALQVAGGVGLRVYISGSTTNAPVIVSFDDLRATS